MRGLPERSIWWWLAAGCVALALLAFALMRGTPLRWMVNAVTANVANDGTTPESSDLVTSWSFIGSGTSPDASRDLTPTVSRPPPATFSCGTDLQAACPAWADQGHCIGASQAWMLANCARSCNSLCASTPTALRPSAPILIPVTPAPIDIQPLPAVTAAVSVALPSDNVNRTEVEAAINVRNTNTTQVCMDEPEWDNHHGLDCKQYAYHNFCKAGSVVPGAVDGH